MRQSFGNRCVDTPNANFAFVCDSNSLIWRFYFVYFFILLPDARTSDTGKTLELHEMPNVSTNCAQNSDDDYYYYDVPLVRVTCC